MNPGLEPTLKDLAKLFLLSDEGKSKKLREKTEILEFQIIENVEHVSFYFLLLSF